MENGSWGGCLASQKRLWSGSAWESMLSMCSPLHCVHIRKKEVENRHF